MLKRLSLAAVLAACTVTTATGGPYDGVWISSALPGDYLFVRDSGGMLIVAELDAGGDAWRPYVGPITGNQAAVSAIHEDLDLRSNITFSSDTVATMTVEHCMASGSLVCQVQAGQSLELLKVY